MIELWIPLTLVAAFAQTARTAVQKHLTAELSTSGNTAIRYFYSVPFVCFYLLFLLHWHDAELPSITGGFAVRVLLAALLQIAGSFLIIALFAHRNVVAGVAYANTTAIQTAILGIAFFEEPLGNIVLGAIMLGMIGVMLISAGERQKGLLGIVKGLSERSSLMGIASGTCYALAVLLIRDANLEIMSDSVAVKAAFSLCFIIMLQALVLFIYVGWRRSGELRKTVRNWRLGAVTGFLSVASNACWFTAVTLETAAHVMALIQIDVIFSLLVTYYYFKEQVHRNEIVGIVLLLGCIVLLIFNS
jgi:drug/metabolite transporter (DMT)-like permease